jgi:hypothetical protein
MSASVEFRVRQHRTGRGARQQDVVGRVARVGQARRGRERQPMTVAIGIELRIEGVESDLGAIRRLPLQHAVQAEILARFGDRFRARVGIAEAHGAGGVGETRVAGERVETFLRQVALVVRSRDRHAKRIVGKLLRREHEPFVAALGSLVVVDAADLGTDAARAIERHRRLHVDDAAERAVDLVRARELRQLEA